MMKVILFFMALLFSVKSTCQIKYQGLGVSVSRFIVQNNVSNIMLSDMNLTAFEQDDLNSAQFYINNYFKINKNHFFSSFSFGVVDINETSEEMRDLTETKYSYSRNYKEFTLGIGVLKLYKLNNLIFINEFSINLGHHFDDNLNLSSNFYDSDNNLETGRTRKIFYENYYLYNTRLSFSMQYPLFSGLSIGVKVNTGLDLVLKDVDDKYVQTIYVAGESSESINFRNTKETTFRAIHDFGINLVYLINSKNEKETN